MADDPQDPTRDDPQWTPTLSDPEAVAGTPRPCVVLASLDTPISQPLHQALQQADLTARVEHDPRMAMAEVCLLRRTARHRAAEGDASAAAVGLVLLTEPVNAARDMVDTLTRMLPDVPVLLLKDGRLIDLDDAPMPRPEVDPDEILSLLGRPGSPEQEPV